MSRKLREALRNVKRFCQGQTTSLVGRDYGDGVSTGSDSDRVIFGREKLGGLRRLERFARSVETQLQPEVNFEAIVAHEQAISPTLNGRTVFDDKPRGRFFVGKGGHQQRLF